MNYNIYFWPGYSSISSCRQCQQQFCRWWPGALGGTGRGHRGCPGGCWLLRFPVGPAWCWAAVQPGPLLCWLSWSCLSVFLFSTTLPLCMQANPMFLSSLGALQKSTGSLLRKFFVFPKQPRKDKAASMFLPLCVLFFCSSFCYFFLKSVVLLI